MENQNIFRAPLIAGTIFVVVGFLVVWLVIVPRSPAQTPTVAECASLGIHAASKCNTYSVERARQGRPDARW